MTVAGAPPLLLQQTSALREALAARAPCPVAQATRGFGAQATVLLLKAADPAQRHCSGNAVREGKGTGEV